jgi:putative tryptophan/tyrosine transport system substrate-binding protein
VRRRAFIAGLGGTALWSTELLSQQRMRTVGLLGTPSRKGNEHFLVGLEGGLAKAGYRKGSNLAFEERWANDVQSELPSLATDLIAHRVEAIVAFFGPAALTAKATTHTIPVVFSTGGDPVQLGLVESYNRPSGNLTGVAQLAGALTAKRLGLLHSFLPNASFVAVLADPQGVTIELQLSSLQEAAVVLNLRLLVTKIVDGDIRSAFENIARERPDAVVITATSFLANHRPQIVELARHYSIPAIYEDNSFVRVGGLVSYGTDFSAVFDQLGLFVGKILDGQTPSQIPVVQPVKFELAINMRTARALDLKVPEPLLATADEVIE